MKFTIILLLGLLLGLQSHAEDKAPKPFNDSEIKRSLKDGKVQEFDGNKYMIVRRGSKTKVAPIIKEVPRDYKKHSVKVFLGYGPNDLEVNNNRRVDLDKDPLLGIGYGYKFTESISVELQGISNETGMVGLGFHF